MKKLLLLALACCLFAVNANAETVKNIEIKGLQRVEKETVLSYININTGDNISDEKLNEAFKQLYATGLFSDISFNEKNGTVSILVEENPIINKRFFDGNDKVDDTMLETEVQLSARSLYSQAKVQEDVQRILSVYKRVGRYSASVEPKIIKRDQNRVDLIYEIDEGPLAKITKINFVGNQHYTANDLQEEILSKETRWWRVFSSSENYDPEKMNYDKELLRRFYQNRGYADFRVISSVAELSPDSQSFIITMVLEEGRRYKLKNVKINSEIKDIDTASLYSTLAIGNGDWYNAGKIEKSVLELTDELGKKGFAFVDVEPIMNKNTETGEMEITFEIQEGGRIFIDRININGNTRTRDSVIRREFRINEGDAFNAAKIRASRRNIENLNYFSKVDIQTIPNENGDKADLNLKVEEKSTGFFNVGVGYSTVNGPLIRTGVTENNFRGTGQQLGFDINLSERVKDYSISFTEPYFLDRPLSAGIDIFRSETDYQEEASYDETTTGATARLGWKYTDDLSQGFRYTLKQDEITNVTRGASYYIKQQEGEYIGSSVGQTMAYDKRDSSVDPKDGYYLSFGNDVAGLGGDEKYLKFDAKAYTYHTFFDYYTLKMFVTGGYIAGYGDEDVRLSQRYFLGGNTMRGFDTAGIGARDANTKDALGGNWMVYSGAELTFPIGLDEVGIKGRTFTDIGMLGKPDGIINRYPVDYSSSPRVSAGVGLSWLSPMGKIDIDFGFPIVKEKYDETQVFRLNFGARL